MTTGHRDPRESETEEGQNKKTEGELTRSCQAQALLANPPPPSDRVSNTQKLVGVDLVFTQRCLEHIGTQGTLEREMKTDKTKTCAAVE
jgi:hypothetical protein